MKKRGRVLTVLLAATLAFCSIPSMVMAQDGVKPEDGTTKGQPFWNGTGESDKFRIPCLVSLNDGTLVAGCDARWTTYADGGGLDTIVSYSKDKGDTWHYTYANYLGDNGNIWHKDSTAFIDPAMATDGETVYMIADLYPAGYALNGARTAPVAGKSHDEKGNILLADASGWNDVWGAERTKATNYTYYLEKNTKEDAESEYLIRDKDGKAVEGYTVDAYFHVKGKDVDTNLFEADSPFQVWPTDYLYMTSSADGGKTWSVPSILNLRRESEQSLLVGPGRGMVTSEGRIIFTAYEYTGGDKNSAVIYSDDGGTTWERGKSVSGWSSEAVATEADDKLYMFTRHGGYYVSDDFGETWSSKKDMGIDYNLNCQLTAITYPQKIDGKTAILFAAPSSTSSRSAGKIFVGLVQADGTIDWKYDYSVNGSAYYAYSCLTVLPDGSVGLLYENAATELTYVNLDIEDIAKGAAVGNIWCTDSEGGTVAEVTMKSSQSQEFTVNGLKDNAQVKVYSDNEQAVQATYENGKVRVSSKQVQDLERAVVKVESEGASTKIKVNVTDATNYEIVELRIGDTKTYMDKTGNYSGSQLENLDKNIATVELKGEDAQTVETQMKAQLATGLAAFDGQKKPLESCMFTFNRVEGQANTYQISAQNGNAKVYVNHKSPSKGGQVCTATATNIELQQQTDGTVAFRDTTSGTAGEWLYFHKDNTAKLCFDRNSKDHVNCHLELYQRTGINDGETEIPGYKKVTDISNIQDDGRYLIAAKASDGNYYVVNPSATDKNYEHVAKVVKEEVAVKPEAAVQLGTSKEFHGEQAKISSCLFTFEKQEGDKYVISSITADGQKVYLTPKTAGTAQTPLTTSSAGIRVGDAGDGKVSFTQEGEGGAGGVLYFHRDASKLYYDRQGTVDDNCKFELFRQSETVENGDIAGYEKVAFADIIDGEQYLVAAQAGDGKYYLLHPAQGAEKYSYVAKVTGEMYEGEIAAAKTEIVITGKAEGKTAVTIGEVAYYIIVQNDVKNVTLKVGETYNLAGKILKEEGNTNIITKEERDNMPPYKAITTVEEGTYLFGNDTHIMLNSQSTVSENPKGLGMTGANFSIGEYAESVWTITKVDSGYTMKDVNGKYVNISGQDVELKDTPQTLTIREKGKGGVSVSNSNMYLNNWANSNNKVAAYSQDNNTWYFYKASSGNVVTAKAVGEVTLVTEGTTYKITVKGDDSQECEHSYTWEITKEATCTEKGVETGTCSKCGETTTRDISELGHDFTDWAVEKEATETEVGKEVRTCQRKNCGVTERRDIPKLPTTPEDTGRSALAKYYKECLEYYKEANYTADSWKVYRLAMDKAKAVLENENATEQEVKDAIAAIKNAAQNLKPVSAPTKPKNDKGEEGKPVKTGDAASAVPFMLGMAGCLGAAVEVIRRRFQK